MELFCFKMILLPCILLTGFFFGDIKTNTIEVNRKNGLSFGDNYVPPGGIAECSRYGGVEFFSTSCQCKNAQGILGTFTDQCDYDLKASSGCGWQIHQSNSPFYMDSATDILNQVFIGTDKTTFVTNCKDIAYLGAKILENGEWNSFAADHFDTVKIGNRYQLKWVNGQQPNTQTWTANYVGQLFKINLGCVPLEGGQPQPSCLLVKIKGKREYTIGDLPTTTPIIPTTTTPQNTTPGLTDQPTSPTTTTPKDGTTPFIDPPITTTTITGEEDDDDPAGVVIGVLFGIIFFIILVLLIICCLHKNEKIDASIMVNKIPVKKARLYFQDHETNNNTKWFGKGVERQPTAQPNHYTNPAVTLNRDTVDAPGNPPRKLSFVQNAKNKIFGKKTQDTSVVIENDNTYEEIEQFQKDRPSYVDITEPPRTPTNPSSPGNELTVPGLGGLSIEEDIYATPDKSPALPLKGDTLSLANGHYKIPTGRYDKASLKKSNSNASSLDGWGKDEFDDHDEDLEVEEEKKDRYLPAEGENDSYLGDEDLEVSSQEPIEDCKQPTNIPPPKKPSTASNDYRELELPPVPPQAQESLPGSKRTSIGGLPPIPDQAPSPPQGTNRPPIPGNRPNIPAGRQRPSLGSLPRQQTLPDGTNTRQPSVPDYKDNELPSPPTSQNQQPRSRKASLPAFLSKTKSNEPRSRKQSLPPPAISNPVRKPSFQDYKNNIVPIPEPPTEETRYPGQDIYIADSDINRSLKQRKPGLPVVSTTATPNKEESPKEDTNGDKDDDVFEDENDDRYQELGNDGNNQDIYVDLKEAGQE
ncbi:uncharacterized protein [Clytia hemisphaerica]|uniref:Cnidarian restricted protein n=1 Tax=Clytia hemisphaerica TaxID=252671 RepID=A0A7M5VDK2_9CNID